MEQVKTLYKLEKAVIKNNNPRIIDQLENDMETLSVIDFSRKWQNVFGDLAQAKLLCLRTESLLNNTVNCAVYSSRWKRKVLQ